MFVCFTRFHKTTSHSVLPAYSFSCTFLASRSMIAQVFMFVVKPMKNNRFLKIKGPIYEPQMGLAQGAQRCPKKASRRHPQEARPGCPDVAFKPSLCSRCVTVLPSLHCAHGASRCSHKLPRPIRTWMLTQVQANSWKHRLAQASPRAHRQALPVSAMLTRKQRQVAAGPKMSFANFLSSTKLTSAQP